MVFATAAATAGVFVTTTRKMMIDRHLLCRSDHAHFTSKIRCYQNEGEGQDNDDEPYQF